jgi:hypothetical protein
MKVSCLTRSDVALFLLMLHCELLGGKGLDR